MSYLIRAGGAEGVAWVATRLGLSVTPHARAVVAARTDGLIRAGVVLDRWTEGAAEIHMCADSPVAFGRLAPEALRYAFGHVSMLLASIRSDNVHALEVAGAAGFSSEHRVLGVYGPGIDLVLLSLRRPAWEKGRFAGRLAA